MSQSRRLLDGLPGDVTHDGGCEASFGIYKGKTSGSYPPSGHPAIHRDRLEAKSLFGC